MDPTRFVYSLAGALIAGEWTAEGIRRTFRQSTADAPLRQPRLIERLLGAFEKKPAFHALSEFLTADAALIRSISRSRDTKPAPRKRRSKPPRKRRVSLRKPVMEQPPVRLADLALPTLATDQDLADWFGISPGHLYWLADVSGRNRRHPVGPLRTYRYRWIPRRDGLPRLLEIPKVRLKLLQQQILEEILNAVPAHPAVHGFRPGRSIVTNAAEHCGKEVVLRFDLTDFFASVTSARVFRIFRTLGYPAGVARLLMGICTTSLPADVWNDRPGASVGADFDAGQRLKSRHLPQGAPTSPALANLAAGRLDRRMSALATAARATYTRYADDLTLSGDASLARLRKRLAATVGAIAAEEGFTLNHRKTRLMRAGARQRVTGVVVNVRPNISRVDYDRLKAILTNCRRTDPGSQNRDGRPDFRAHLLGKIAHVASIHPGRGEKLMAIFRQIRWDEAPFD